MDRNVRNISRSYGEHSSCYCFRDTCQICAPSIKTSKASASTNSNKRKNYEHFEKLNVVPSFFQLFKEIFKYFFTYKKNKFLK